ncbi:NADH-quinone oxidoreductase subunit C [Tepidibacillus marianensis]|uniref:NADH-quinone oxidoreductase subunit C n=1 Tax=Tepidibacillus marianensis TaxID=3131995 RepID=UPI0030D021FA
MSEEVKASSPKQPLLDQYVKLIQQQIGEEAVKESFINEPNAHMPVLIIDKAKWHEVAKLVKDHPEMKFNYLMNLAGVDYEKYMEVAYHFYSYSRDEYLTVKVQTDRDGGSVPTIMDLWATADWHEREAYDLLGIGFTGREITRILLPDEWVGYPLRKDYKPYDEEV